MVVQYIYIKISSIGNAISQPSWRSDILSSIFSGQQLDTFSRKYSDVFFESFKLHFLHHNRLLEILEHLFVDYYTFIDLASHTLPCTSTSDKWIECIFVEPLRSYWYVVFIKKILADHDINSMSLVIPSSQTTFIRSVVRQVKAYRR